MTTATVFIERPQVRVQLTKRHKCPIGFLDYSQHEKVKNLALKISR
jgi:hypothetical protein